MKLLHSTLLAATILPLLVACGSSDTGSSSAAGADDGDVASAIPEGKADNYLSTTSQEYFLSGDVNLTLGEDWAGKTAEEKEARANQLAAYKAKAYAHFVNVYLTDKEHEESNHDYGGYGALVRQTSVETMVDKAGDDGMNWTVLWEIEMAAPRDLLSKLPIETRAGGEKFFKVKVPVLTSWQLEHSSYPSHFDPSKYTQEMEEIEVTIQAEKESFDAFPEYDKLFEDGKLDALILVGGDYNAERNDLKSTKLLFDWLKKSGYKNPATDYTDLTLDSPPFTKSIKVAGKSVKVEVTLYWGDIVPISEHEKLRAKIVEAYKNMDVVLYDGHAGQDPSYSGVVYHYNPRYAIPADDFAKLPLTDKYQIFMFNGCKTYNTYPEGMYKNPAKNTKNLDVISTVNFSWLSMQAFTTSGFLVQLLKTKAGQHDPQTYTQILDQINKSANQNVYYGVHGLDDNPHINPYADLDTLCQSCTRSSQCPGNGNMCVGLGAGNAVCAAECTADDGCPDGYKCQPITVGSKVFGHQCLPKGLVCR